MPPRLLVTAGPTREYLDPVRYITNRATGELGITLAREARRAGFGVTLLLGAVDAPALRGIRVLRYETTQDLSKLLAREFQRSDALLMTAAVGDFIPARLSARKMKRTPSLTVRFRETPDLVAGVAKRKGRRIVVGFSLETEAWRAHARRKKRAKQLDVLVATRLVGRGHHPFGRNPMDALILNGGARAFYPRVSKRRLARLLLRILVQRLHALPRWRNW